MHGIATKNDRRASWVLILLAVSSSTAAICSDIYSIFTSDSGIKSWWWPAFNWIQVNARHSCRLKLSTLNLVVIFSRRDAFDEMCNFWFFCYELTKILYINQLTKNLWSSNKKLIFLCRIAWYLPSLQFLLLLPYFSSKVLFVKENL